MNQTQTREPSLTIRRTFKADRERVFTAWTDPAVQAKWVAPGDTTFEEAQCDPRPGGSFRWAMRKADGEAFVATGVYKEVRRPDRLVFTHRWLEDDPADEHETLITVELIARGGETEMIFTHERLRDEASRDRHVGGWGMCFDNIAEVVEG